MTSPPVDWSLAEATGRRLARPGPTVTHDEAAAAVADLRDLAVRAQQHVVDVTGLQPGTEPVPVHIVDRHNWIASNVAGFAELLRPLSAPVSAVTSRITGIEAGALMAYLSTRVLGQYDPYTGAAGQLMLVAPNVVQAERELAVAPRDFRLWVALHEQTHVLQFTHGDDNGAWLRGHLRSRISVLLEQVDFGGEVFASVARGVAARLRGASSEFSLMDLVGDAEQRELVSEITAVMSLLEGHADLVMDEVGPEVIPSVAAIRSRFDRRRSRGGVDGALRTVLGMEAKLRQYRDGAAFCRTVLGRVGMAGLNRVFTDPSTLPTLGEIAAPELWLERVRPSA